MASKPLHLCLDFTAENKVEKQKTEKHQANEKSGKGNGCLGLLFPAAVIIRYKTLKLSRHNAQMPRTNALKQCCRFII